MWRNLGGLLAALLLPCAATAQVSGSVAIATEYLYRGLQSSSGEPVAQFGLAYDSPDGWYAGAFATRALTAPTKAGRTLSMVYAGYARQFGQDWSLDSGVAIHMARNDAYDYDEAYIGLGWKRIMGRMSYSPDYDGRGTRTLYTEVNASHRLAASLDAVLHVGYLAGMPVPADGGIGRRLDASIGLASVEGDWRLQVALASLRKLDPGAYSWAPSRGSRVVASATRHF